jgi:hypothetical protein
MKHPVLIVDGKAEAHAKPPSIRMPYYAAVLRVLATAELSFTAQLGSGQWCSASVP